LDVSVAKSCQNLKDSLITSHTKLCPWPDNPCPGMREDWAYWHFQNYAATHRQNSCMIVAIDCRQSNTLPAFQVFYSEKLPSDQF